MSTNDKNTRLCNGYGVHCDGCANCAAPAPAAPAPTESAVSIQRHGFLGTRDRQFGADAEGDYVRYADHLAALEARAEEARREGYEAGKRDGLAKRLIGEVVAEHEAEKADQRTAGGGAVAALAPFAAIADLYAPQEDDSYEVTRDADSVAAARITLGQCRAARAALAQRPAADSAAAPANEHVAALRQIFTALELAAPGWMNRPEPSAVAQAVAAIRDLAGAAAAPGADALLRELVSQADGVPFMPVALSEELANRIRAYLAPQPVEEAAAQADGASAGRMKAEHIDAIEMLGRDDPTVHAFLTMKRRDRLEWADVLAQMVLHLAEDKKNLTSQLAGAARLAAPAAQPAPIKNPADAESAEGGAVWGSSVAQPALTDDERAEFEKFAATKFLATAMWGCGTQYTDSWTQKAWEAWQARAALRQPQDAGKAPAAWMSNDCKHLVWGVAGSTDGWTPLYAAAPTSKADAEDAARWRYLIVKGFDFHFKDQKNSVGTTYGYFGPKEAFAKWVEEKVDAARALAAKQAGEVKP